MFRNSVRNISLKYQYDFSFILPLPWDPPRKEKFDYWPTIYPLHHCDSVRNNYLFLKVNSGQDNRQDFQCTFDKKIKRQNNAEPISFLFWTALARQRENGFQFTGWNCGLPGHEKRMDRNKCWQENISCKRGQNDYLQYKLISCIPTQNAFFKPLRQLTLLYFWPDLRLMSGGLFVAFLPGLQ